MLIVRIIHLYFMFISLLLKFRQEVLMGKAGYFESFKQNADDFICSLLPGISHPQVQYSPGIDIITT